MPSYLKQSTSVDVGIGPFLDETDGKTAETGLTITQPDIRLKKNGGAWAQKNAAQTLTHEENGWYEVTLDATDTNTLGILIVAIHESGALPVWKEYMVLPANVYDSLVSGSDVLDVSATQFAGQTITCSGGVTVPAATLASTTNITAGTVTTATNVTTVNGLAANVITAAATAADFGTEIGTAVWATTTRQLTGTQTFNLTGDITGNLSGSVGSVTAGVTVSTNNDKTGYRLSSTGVDDVLDEAVEGSATLRQYVRGFYSALLGKSSGHESGSPVYRDAADSKDRITATTDANGNRTAITIDLT